MTLRGSVTGSNGIHLEGAQVKVLNREVGGSREVVTGPNGTYHLLGLASGVYDVTVRAVGYRPQVHENMRLVFGQLVLLDVTLEPGPIELERTVVTAGRPLEIRRGDVSTAVLDEEIARLPLNSRNVLNLAAIAPGVRNSAPSAARSIPAAGGLPAPRFINFYVDGVEWKGMYIGNLVGQAGLGTLLPQEAVREFRVYLNPYDAEYTRGASWIISAVTHRGSNQLEGSGFAYVQNDALDASSSAQYQRYQAGVNLRGPLARDRAFFSVSYEGQFTDNYIDVVPTSAPGIWDQYAGSFKAPLRLHAGLVRLTVPRGSHTLDAIWAPRYVANESNFGFIRDLVMQSRDAGTRLTTWVNSVQLIDTYASASFLNEFSLNFFESTNDEYPLAPGPTFRYPGIQWGVDIYPLEITSRQLRAVNKATAILGGGAHTLKAGVEVSRVRTTTYRPNSRDGLFVFFRDTSSQPTSGRVGVSYLDSASTQGARVETNAWLVGGYLQDQWQLSNRLTLTAGLRYDAEINTLNQDQTSVWASDTTLQRALGDQYLNDGDRENDTDNIAPRVSLSWDVFGTGRWIARSGYGVMYDRVPVFGAQDELIAAGWRTYDLPSPGTTDPDSLRRLVSAGSGTPTAPNIALLKDRLEAPRNKQWSVGLGHYVGSRVALNVDYIMQRVQHAYVTVNRNARNPQTGQRAITDRFGNILVWDDFGDSRYNAVLGSLTYDDDASRLNLSYTLSWAKSEFWTLTTSDFPDSASYSMQRSPADERHRMVLSGFTGVAGLDFSAMVTLASPQPFLVTTGVDSTNGTTIDDWPDGSRTLRRSGWNHWYRAVDVRIGKTIPLRGRGQLVLTAEAFNVVGWTNHFQYQNNAAQSSYGEPLSDYPGRQVQLGLRYQF